MCSYIKVFCLEGYIIYIYGSDMYAYIIHILYIYGRLYLFAGIIMLTSELQNLRIFPGSEERKSQVVPEVCVKDAMAWWSHSGCITCRSCTKPELDFP